MRQIVTNSKMEDLSPIISITTFNVYDLKFPTQYKGQRLTQLYTAYKKPIVNMTQMC